MSDHFPCRPELGGAQFKDIMYCGKKINYLKFFCRNFFMFTRIAPRLLISPHSPHRNDPNTPGTNASGSNLPPCSHASLTTTTSLEGITQIYCPSYPSQE